MAPQQIEQHSVEPNSGRRDVVIKKRETKGDLIRALPCL